MDKPMKNNKISRRRFLKQSASLSTLPLIPSFSLFAKDELPSEKVGIGIIGSGNRGRYLTSAVMDLKGIAIRAICDVRQKDIDDTLALVRKKFNDVQIYTDFRELIARNDIDAVIIATPDHWHATIAILSAQAGKDMYVEKPLAISIQDDLKIRDAVIKHNRIFQFGTQQRSNENFLFACELVRNGYIGELKKIRVGCPCGIVGPNCNEEPIPEGFHYDMWLGPAPYKPFCKSRTITPYWYHISDYAMGFVGGWGIHHIDIAQWGHGNDDRISPIQYEGKGEFASEGICDTVLHWEVEAKYPDGVILHYTDEQTQAKEPHRNPTGVTFEGTEGSVYVSRETLQTRPEKLMNIQFKSTDTRLYPSKNHMQNFIDCVRSRKQTISPVDIAIRSNVICILSDVAIRTGKIIRLDNEKQIIIDPPEIEGFAKELIHRSKREGFNWI